MRHEHNVFQLGAYRHARHFRLFEFMRQQARQPPVSEQPDRTVSPAFAHAFQCYAIKSLRAEPDPDLFRRTITGLTGR